MSDDPNPDGVQLTADDLAGILQRKCRQLERYFDREDLPLNPMLVLQHIGAMHDMAMALARALLARQAANGEAQEAAPANGEAKAH